MDEKGTNLKLIDEIINLVDKYKKLVCKPNKVASIWKEHLELGKSILEWSIKKYNIYFDGTSQVVKKKYIFYCELGFNIGSEQSGKRPVVILQNDKGNNSSTTTIVAPITTHRGLKVIEQLANDKVKVEVLNDNGKAYEKILDYYEVPVVIENGFKKQIIGYINLAQIRTLSKKRLDKSHVAVITEDTNMKIQRGLIKLLAFKEK